MRDPSAVRVVPKRAVTVTIEADDSSLVYGVVANISEKGACLWTSGSFEPGQSLTLRLSFPRERQPVQVSGRVVWSGTPPESKDARHCGVHFRETPGITPARLKALISGLARGPA